MPRAAAAAKRVGRPTGSSHDRGASPGRNGAGREQAATRSGGCSGGRATHTRPLSARTTLGLPSCNDACVQEAQSTFNICINSRGWSWAPAAAAGATANRRDRLGTRRPRGELGAAATGAVTPGLLRSSPITCSALVTRLARHASANSPKPAASPQYDTYSPASIHGQAPDPSPPRTTALASRSKTMAPARALAAFLAVIAPCLVLAACPYATVTQQLTGGVRALEDLAADAGRRLLQTAKVASAPRRRAGL
jgi:hypothetical protein